MPIINFKNSRRKELNDFLERNYKPKYILTNDKFFRWFLTNLKIVLIGGKISGMIGIISNPLHFFGKTVKSSFLVNLMVDKSLRHVGLGPLLINKSQQNSDILMVSAFTEEVGSLYQKLSWQIMSDMRRFVKVIDAKQANLLMNSKVELQKSESVSPFADAKYDVFTFERIDLFGHKQDAFWQKIKSKYPIATERTSQYLNQRYGRHPLFQYYIFVARKQEEIKAYIIFRIAEVKEFGIRIAIVVDFIAESDAEVYVLQKVVNFCHQNKIALIDFFFTGNFHTQSLNKAGFIEANKEPYSLTPILINPIERNRRMRVNFAFKVASPEIIDKRIEDINNWYITAGDGDRDRPN